jgi:hypothetical protein
VDSYAYDEFEEEEQEGKAAPQSMSSTSGTIGAQTTGTIGAQTTGTIGAQSSGSSSGPARPQIVLVHQTKKQKAEMYNNDPNLVPITPMTPFYPLD